MLSKYKKGNFLPFNKSLKFFFLIFIIILSLGFLHLNTTNTLITNHSSSTRSIDFASNINNHFLGGFLSQSAIGDHYIQYFIQTPHLFVGFGNSTIKVLIANNISNSSKAYTQITLSFGKCNNVNPLAENATGNYFSSFHTINETLSQVHIPYYAKLVYHNLYHDIDLEFVLQDGNLKYNFYVYPGGDPSVIKMNWSGPVFLIKNENHIEINLQNSKDTIFDSDLVVYQKGP